MSNRVYDRNGWFEVKDNPISKAGVFQYLGSSIDFDGKLGLDPNGIYNVLRSASELRDEECIESFKLIPWTDNHPAKLLGNRKGFLPAEKKGVEGTTGETIYFDENDETLKGNIKVFTENLDNEIDRGKRELSIGYGCKYRPESGHAYGKDYQFAQTTLRGNHLASVEDGRSGPDISVLDSKETLIITMDSKELTMDSKELEKLVVSLDEAVKGIKATLDAAEEEKKKAADMEEEEKKKAEDEAAEKKKAEDEEAAAKKKAEDEETPEEKKKREEEEAKKKESGGMDAMIAENKKLKKDLGALTATVDSIEKDGIKTLMGAIGKRNALAESLSQFVGTFDHSEMNENEVAVYGVEKLELKCAAGSELATLNGYLHNREVPVLGHSFDSKDRGALKGKIKAHTEGSK